MSEMTLNARARILGRLRASAPDAAKVGTVEALDASIDTHFNQRRAQAPATLAQNVQRFQQMLEAVHADVFCASADAWPAELARRLAEAGVRRLLLDTSSKEGAALANALPSAVQTLTYAQPIEAWKSELFETVDAGFTVARSGLAATGTLIVVPDANALARAAAAHRADPREYAARGPACGRRRRTLARRHADEPRDDLGSVEDVRHPANHGVRRARTARDVGRRRDRRRRC